jgi:hypothetical protein
MPERTLHFKGDAMRLAQVLANPINNAAKWTRGKGLIPVKLKPMGGDIYLHVRDNGLGMSEALITHAFDLFVQDDRGRDRSEDGLGIDLTLVKRIVALHGGTVTASSDGPGKGSEFMASLPASGNDVAPAQPVESHLQTVQTRNILVVDDKVDAANSLSLLLTMSGHALTVAHDGPEALQLADRLVPDVMLLDIEPARHGWL